MAELSDIEAMVDDWERNAVEKSQRYERMQREVERISITESVAGGAVSVTVGHNGLPTDIRMTEAVRRMSPDQIAGNVLQAMRKAQARYPEKLRQVMAETVGEDQTTRHIAETAEANFPPPPPEEPPPSMGRQLDVGPEIEDEPPARRPAPPGRQAPQPRPAAPRRPPSSGEDDEDFGDQTFLRPGTE